MNFIHILKTTLKILNKPNFHKGPWSSKMESIYEVNSPSYESFTVLVDELIKTVCKSLKLKNNKRNRTIRKSLYNILFSERKDINNDVNKLSDVEKLLWYSHTLRQRRRFDDSNKLDNIYKIFVNNGLLENDVVRSVLCLLTSLKDNEFQNKRTKISTPSPWISSAGKVDSLNLPDEPLCFNDTRHDAAFSRWHYTHFPSYLFNADDNLKSYNVVTTWNVKDFSSCSEEPGNDHHLNFLRKDECDTDKSCFGALIGPKRLKSPITPDTVLSIPNLPQRPEGYSFIQSSSLKMPISNSENLFSISKTEKNLLQRCIPSQYINSTNSLAVKCDIWEEVLKENYSHSRERYTWESVVRSSSQYTELRDSPFASEVGPAVTQKLWSLEQSYIFTIDSCFNLPSNYHISSEKLSLHLLHLLCGIPSSNFYISEENLFEIQEGIFYDGVTPESVYPHLEEFLLTGNKVLRLEDFCRPASSENNAVSDNLSIGSFKRAVKNFLYYFRNKVLSLKGESKFLDLKLKTKVLRNKLDFVYEICCKGIEKNWFSNSLCLIGELFRELLSTRCQSDLYLLLSFVSATCRPFLIFLEKWIYDGEFCDPSSEFMIKVNSEFLLTKTRNYWTESYSLSDRFIQLLPERLGVVLVKAYECGKAMNMLRLCSPQNFLCNGFSNHPDITFCSSLNEVMCKRIECQKYGLKMTHLSSKHLVTLQDLDRQLNSKENYLRILSNERHMMRLKYFQETRLLEQSREIEEKRRVLDSIKEDLKSYEYWKDKRKEDEANLVEKARLEQQIMDEQKKLKDYREKSNLLDIFNEEVNKLKSDEHNLENQLKDLRMKLNYNKKTLVKEEYVDHLKNSNFVDIDTESLSQMSISSDAVETPVEDYLQLTETINEDKENVIDNDKNDTDGQNNNFNLTISVSSETGEKIISDAFQDDSHANAVEYSDFSSNEVLLINKKSDDFSNNNSNVEAVSGFLSNEMNEDKNNILPVGEKVNGIIYPQYKTDSLSTERERKKITMQCLEVRDNNLTEKREKEDNVCITEKSFGLRKSKSESNSLKDSDIKLKKGKGTDRYSLYDFQEAPVLIDQVGGETLKWRGRSIYGHASDSVIQKILFGNTCENKETNDKESISKVSFLDEELREYISNAHTSVVQPYSHSGKEENKCPVTLSFPFFKEDTEKDCVKNFENIGDTSLSFSSLYIARGISEHLEVQSELASKVLLSHFFVERKLLEHFSFLKKFLLLHDASFARTMIQNLINKFTLDRPSSSFVSPVELNGILNEAIVASSSPKNSFASNLHFIVTNLTSNSYLTPLDTINLRYTVSWPLCIIVDEKVLKLYSTVSKFLIRLHQVMLTIEDAYRYMISLRSHFAKTESIHYHQINIFRHEVQQLVRVIFGYISHQAIEGSWYRFQKNLRDNVTTLDDLYITHVQFVQEVSEKCFLTSTFSFVYNLIQQIFTEVFLFCNLLKSSSWNENFQNTRYKELSEGMEKFRELSSELNKRLLKLLQYTQLREIEDFVLHLNFNENFKN